MFRVLFLVLLFIGSLSADFFVVDGGVVVKITNEPIGGANIVGTNGKLLKKYKTMRLAKKSAKRYRYKKKYSKKIKIRKKRSYKKTKVSRKIRAHKKKYVSKKRRSSKKRVYKKKLAHKKKKIKDYIVIKTSERKLYHYLNNRLDRIYSIAVGKEGFQHYGTYRISNKKKWPDWVPTKTVREEVPSLPEIVKGGKHNPLGARALYLGTSAYRIHGTNRPNSIGKASSHGCFRMRNEDVINLYNRTRLGTKVYIR